MHSIKTFFEKTEIILLLAIALPFIISFKSKYSNILIQLLLGIMMFFSIRSFFNKKFNLKKEWRPILSSVFFNYVLLSGIYLLLAYLFFGVDNIFFTGYVLLAIVPPAIAIIPLCYAAKCDSEAADSALFLSYILALIIIPVTVYLAFGKSVDMWGLSKIILFIIILPISLAYLLRKSQSQVFSYTKAFSNICLGAVLFLVIDMNKKAFIDFSDIHVIFIYLVNILVIFGTGLLTYLISSYFVSKDKAITYTLYASHKNEGTAIALGILLFNPITALPAILAMVLQTIFYIFFEKVFLKYSGM